MSTSIVSTAPRRRITRPGGRPARTAGRAARPGGGRVGLVLSVLVLVVAAAWALVPGLFTSYPPNEGVAADAMLGPSLQHLLGTDYLGRDMFSRVVHGAYYSVTGGLVAVSIAAGGGALLGLAAGALGGWFDTAVSTVLDVVLAIPGLLLLLSLVATLGFGNIEAAVAIGVSGIPQFARVVRSEVIKTRVSPFVEAARGSGSRGPALLLRHVLPNSLTPAWALVPLEFGGTILTLAALSFLGFGAPPPTPEWGLLVADGRKYVGVAWWLTILPGIVLILVVLSANYLGRRARKLELR